MKLAVPMIEEKTLDIPSLTKKCMADPELRKNGKTVPDFAKKVATDYLRSSPEMVRSIAELNETALLRSCEKFLSEEMGTEVKVYSANEENLYDPQGKSRVAIPGRPAILLE